MRTRFGFSDWRYWSAVVPIPLLLAIMFVLWVAELRTVYDAPRLNMLNVVFTMLNSLFIAYLAARSFSTRGAPALLMLGCGVLVWGVSGSLSMALGKGDPNQIVTIHNLCAALSAACHLASALLSLRPGLRIRARELWLGLAYTGMLSAVAVIVVAAQSNWMPIFFIQGQGGTPLRQGVLLTAIFMFVLSALILMSPRRDSKPPFTCWYGMGLLLIATGIFGIMIQPAFSSILGWTGRLAQYLGAAYMLIAAIAALRESGSWELALEAQLHQARQDYTSLLDLAADGIVEYAPDSQSRRGRFVQVNPAICRLLGYSAEELLAMAPEDIFVSEDQAAMLGDSQAIKQGRTLRHEARLTTKGGSSVSVEISTRFFEQQGRPRVMSIIRDVTRRKQMERAVRESVERYELVVQGANAAIWDWDVVNHKIFYSPQWKALRGLGENESGDSEEVWRSSIHPEDAPRVMGAVEAHFDGRTPFFAEEYRIRCNDGSWKWISDRGICQRDASGRVVRMAGSETDITERREAHAKLEAMVRERTAELSGTLEKIQSANAQLDHQARQLRALAGELTMTEQRERKRLSIILHDGLQQHLAAAKLQVGGLREQVQDDAARESVGAAETMLAEALQISRSLTAELSPPILHDGGLPAGLQWLKRWMRDKHHFEVELACEEVAEPLEDIRLLLFESVRELLFNAAKHSRVSRAQVHTRQLDTELQIVVRDEGSGFDPEQIKTAGGEAAGFGLFSIFERLKLVGGALEIDSAPGKGSTFRLRVPMSRNVPEPIQTDAEGDGDSHSRMPPSAGDIRVLVADDHALFRDGVARLLSRETDMQVVGHAADGREVIDLARKLSPDVILMDISMPDINGIEATRIITQRYPRIRIIGLSMHEDRERDLVLAAGAVGYRTKSCSPAELLLAVRTCMSKVPGAAV
jgi:PAS domain S-box-containing protein